MFEMYCVFTRLCGRVRLADDPAFHVVVMPRGLSYSVKIAIGSIDMVGDEDSQVSTARRVFLYALFCRASAVFFED
jgi:hypothetical protein